MSPIGSRALATFLLGLAVAAQSPADKDAKKAAAVQRQAEQSGKAVVDGDYETLVKLTHPALVKEIGGRETMIATTKAAMEDLKEKGFRIVAYSVDPPDSFVAAGKTLYTVVPTRIEMSAPGGKLIARSYLIGVSGDEGANWTFVDGSGKAELTKKILPDLPGTLKLPEPQQPKFVADR